MCACVSWRARLQRTVLSSEQEAGHPEHLAGRDECQIRRIAVEQDLVPAWVHRVEDHRIDHLIILLRRVDTANVRQFPLDLILHTAEDPKLDLELKFGAKGARVVVHDDVGEVDHAHSSAFLRACDGVVGVCLAASKAILTS